MEIRFDGWSRTRTPSVRDSAERTASCANQPILMFVEGFEPSASGFVDQRSKFPLSYTNKVRVAGFEPASACSQGKWAAAAPHPETQMEPVGLEPTISSLQDWRLSSLATIPGVQISIRQISIGQRQNRSGGDRTHDGWLVGPVLLPLSYAPR